MISIEACEPYFEFVSKYAELDLETKKLIASQISEITFPPKQIILSEGAICNKVYFLISGTARSYFISFSGLTITWIFHFNNDQSLIKNVFVTDHSAFVTNSASSVTIETLSELHALVFTRQAVNYLMDKSSKFESWMRKVSDMRYASMFKRIFSLLTMSATERYHKLLDEDPHLLQMFSSQHIASYLGIAPQSLSRIRMQH
jgi:CRP-like cAMP-binding protein